MKKQINEKTTELDEIDIILNLREVGPMYFDTMLKNHNSTCDKKIKNTILSFEKMYISDTELFEFGIKKYIDYLNNTQTTLVWNSLSETLTHSEIIDYITKFCDFIGTSDYSDLTKLQILKKILISQNIKNALIKCDNIWDIILGPLLNNIDITQNKWYLSIKMLQTIVKSLIKINKNIKSNFVVWLSKLTNLCVSKIHIDFGNYNDTLPNDIYLSNLLGLLLVFWRESMKVPNELIGTSKTKWCNLTINNKLEKLNYDYIISNKCAIKWFDKKIQNDTMTYNFTTECMFLILNTLRVGYIPIMYRSIKWSKLSIEMNNEINHIKSISTTIQNSANQFVSVALKNMQSQKDLIDKFVDIDNKIINNYVLSEWVHDFYNQIDNWIVMNKNKLVDDILSDMLYYFNNTSCFCCGTDDTRLLLLDIMDTKTYTTNMSIKCEALKCFVRSDTSEFSRKDTNVNNIVFKFASVLLNLHAEINSAHTGIVNDVSAKIMIYSTMDALYFNNENHSIIDALVQVMANDTNITKRFLNIIFMDLCDVLDNIDKLYEKLNEAEEDDDDSDIVGLTSTLFTIFNFCIKMTSFIDNLIKIMVINDTLKNVILSREIFCALATSLNSTLNKLSTRVHYDPTLGLYDEDDGIIQLKTYKSALMNIYKTLRDNNCDWTLIIQDNSFNIEYYEEFDLNTKKKIHDIIEIITDKINENNNVKEIDTTTAPNEFIDPITYTLIDNPCLLPGMVGFSDVNVYFDKLTIIKQLLVKEENPYTRSKLTIKEFEDFNNLPHIKTYNDKLIEEIKLWKNSI